ncbi:MAG: phenylacetate--CoA ligase family protein, partial [Reyranellaceae bacterium]
MAEHFDDLETRDPQQREAALMAALPKQIAHVLANTPYFAEKFKGVKAGDINSREALAKLPVTRKSSLLAQQRSAPPFGGMNGVPIAKLAHIYMSPGPIFEMDAEGHDFWRGARAMFAAGFRAGDIVHNTFSYHLVPAGLMMESSARAIGCPVIPAGVGNTEMQLDIIELVKPSAYAGTPSFLKILLDKGKELGRDVSSLKKALVGAEALPPSLRKEFIDRGVFTLQSYGTADLGTIAYESQAMEGMIIAEDIILEIVRPGTDDPVPEGEVGEVVVTALNPVYPLIRFGTGDLSAILPGRSPCGRTNGRIKGWMGRADQRTKVKGMFVDPEQVIQVQKRHAELGKVRLVVDWQNKADVMTLHAEIANGGSPELATTIEGTIQAVCKVRGKV